MAEDLRRIPARIVRVKMTDVHCVVHADEQTGPDSDELTTVEGVVQEAEGLKLHLSARSASGYLGIIHLPGKAKPFRALVQGTCPVHLGYFASAVEAAVCYARHVQQRQPEAMEDTAPVPTQRVEQRQRDSTGEDEPPLSQLSWSPCLHCGTRLHRSRKECNGCGRLNRWHSHYSRVVRLSLRVGEDGSVRAALLRNGSEHDGRKRKLHSQIESSAKRGPVVSSVAASGVLGMATALHSINSVQQHTSEVVAPPGTLQERFAAFVMCDFTPRRPSELPVSQWVSYQRLFSLFKPHASQMEVNAEILRPGNLKLLIIEWYKTHPAFTGLVSDKWCKKMRNNDQESGPDSHVFKFCFELTGCVGEVLAPTVMEASAAFTQFMHNAGAGQQPQPLLPTTTPPPLALPPLPPPPPPLPPPPLPQQQLQPQPQPQPQPRPQTTAVLQALMHAFLCNDGACELNNCAGNKQVCGDRSPYPHLHNPACTPCTYTAGAQAHGGARAELPNAPRAAVGPAVDTAASAAGPANESAGRVQGVQAVAGARLQQHQGKRVGWGRRGPLA